MQNWLSTSNAVLHLWQKPLLQFKIFKKSVAFDSDRSIILAVHIENQVVSRCEKKNQKISKTVAVSYVKDKSDSRKNKNFIIKFSIFQNLFLLNAVCIRLKLKKSYEISILQNSNPYFLVEFSWCFVGFCFRQKTDPSF